MRRIEAIGQKIRVAREMKGMSVSELAKVVGLISYIFMEDIEAGFRIPPNEQVCKKIAEVLSIDLLPYEDYQAALSADSREEFEKNKASIIGKLNEDFGTNLSEDATMEDFNAVLMGKYKIK